MTKALALLAVTVLLTGCQTDKRHSVTEADLLHRNYVLIHFDGQTIRPHNMKPRIEFGETFFVSGAMCNDFAGQGQLTNNELKVTNMVTTQALCSDEVNNELDSVMAQMLTDGAQLILQNNTLILKNNRHRLTFMNKDWVY